MCIDNNSPGIVTSVVNDKIIASFCDCCIGLNLKAPYCFKNKTDAMLLGDVITTLAKGNCG